MLPKLFSQDEQTNDRIWIAWILVLVIGMIGTLLGVQFPIPPLPADVAEVDFSPQGVTSFTGLNFEITTATMADGDTLTPTDTFYHLDAASAVTITLSACSQDGDLLVLFGDDNYTITITDTNIRTTDGNAATLGQYDILWWICETTEWIHVAKSGNS